MIVRCANCGSAVTQALLDINQCLGCGALLEQDGSVRPSRGESESGVTTSEHVFTGPLDKAGNK